MRSFKRNASFVSDRAASAWLVAFTQRVLSHVPRDERDRLRTEARVVLCRLRPWAPRSLSFALPSWREVGRWQRTAQRGLLGLLEPGPTLRLPVMRWGLTMNALRARMLRATLGWPSRLPLEPVIRSRRDAWTCAVIGLLTASCDLFRACTGCRTVFLALTRRQRWCTPACCARWGMRRHRHTPPERYGKIGRPPHPRKETTHGT